MNPSERRIKIGERVVLLSTSEALRVGVVGDIFVSLRPSFSRNITRTVQIDRLEYDKVADLWREKEGE